MKFRVEQIAKITAAKQIIGNNQSIVSQIIVRKDVFSCLPDSLYFDLKNDFDFKKLYSLGIRCFVLNNSKEEYYNYQDCSFVIVNDVHNALNDYLSEVYSQYFGKIIAINQKDNLAKDWMYQLLSPIYKTFCTIKFVDEFDFVEDASTIDQSFDYAIIEIPDQYSIESISLIEKQDKTSKENIDYSIDTQILSNQSVIKISNGVDNYQINIPFCDDYHIQIASSCLVYLVENNIYNPNIHNQIFSNLAQNDGLIRLRKADYDTGVISCFSTINNIYSINKCFDFVSRQKQFREKVAVIMHPNFQTLNTQDFFDKLFFASKSAGIKRLIFIEYYQKIPHNQDILITKYDTVEDFIDNFNSLDFEHNAILFKGEEFEDFAKVFDFFNTGNHDTVLEVNLNALKHNMLFYRSLLKKQTKMVAMVKANAYGSGAVEVSNMLQNNGIDYLCVAFVEEGIELRRANITKPIIVMNYDGYNYRQLVNYKLEPVLFSVERTQKLIQILKSRKISNYPVHIKLDTGMHRSGFMPEELDAFCSLVNQNANVLSIKSILTHFVSADDESDDDFSHLQIDRFYKHANYIINQTNQKPLLHICNSVGIERFTDFQYNMVRLGIGLYGVAYNSTQMLMPIAKWKTNIVQIKHISPSETVGYNRRGKIFRDSKIALLPVGYADGLNRKFGNGNLKVTINGQEAPILGNICMDMCMIDITDVNCKIGDEVIIFDSSEKLVDMANSISTICYEVLTNISKRVSRVYVE